jgi:hypothetical protein
MIHPALFNWYDNGAMTAEFRKKAQELDVPSERGWRFLLLSWLTATVALAVVIAASFEQRGESRFTSVVYGAAVATSITVIALTLYGVGCRAVWKRVRGYPFRIGDIVTITSGPHSGMHGQVVSVGQGEFDFRVELGSEDTGGESYWFQVTKLRKLNA